LAILVVGGDEAVDGRKGLFREGIHSHSF
jgi:hypothetical protein